jgi:hypothetical protein
LAWQKLASRVPHRKRNRRRAMPVNKPHLEFHRVDMSSGWSTPPGYPAGIEQKILAGTLDEKSRSGSRTRLLRFAPGVFTTEPFVHEYWEEVYLIEGDLTVGNDSAGAGGENFPRGTYACRRRAQSMDPSGRTAAVCSTRSIISSNNGSSTVAAAANSPRIAETGAFLHFCDRPG